MSDFSRGLTAFCVAAIPVSTKDEFYLELVISPLQGAPCAVFVLNNKGSMFGVTIAEL